MKVPRQCPLVLLVKAGWRGGKTVNKVEMKGGARTQIEQCSTAFNYNPDFRY
jgi:hypothetical protein